jgi:hypothetical protein
MEKRERVENLKTAPNMYGINTEGKVTVGNKIVHTNKDKCLFPSVILWSVEAQPYSAVYTCHDISLKGLRRAVFRNLIWFRKVSYSKIFLYKS